MRRLCYQHQMLSTSDGHQIYYELSGNPEGVPVLVIHGGPGAGLSHNYTDFFDLNHYHVIGFDQRGCGRSQPFLSLQNNTTQDLLADISLIRNHLGVKQWLLFGGSWGTTLALLAAIREPESILGLILRGVFLARAEDFHWFLAPDGGAAQVYPDAYSLFTDGIAQPADLAAVLTHYRQAFQAADTTQRNQAALRWYHWEEAIAKVYRTPSVNNAVAVNPAILSLAILEWHFITHQCFIQEDQIINNIHHLAGIPARIIHGRCDTVCKPQGAYHLHRHWPGSHLTMVDGAGHSSSEPGIAMALRQATHDFLQHR